VSKISGTHTFKMGFYFEHTQKLQSASRRCAAISALIPTPTIREMRTIPTPTRCSATYDSYAEATGRPQGNYIFTNLEWFFRTTGRCEGICRSATACASTTTYRNTTLEISSRRSLQRPGIPRQHPVLIRPAVVNGQNVGIDPLTGKNLRPGTHR